MLRFAARIASVCTSIALCSCGDDDGPSPSADLGRTDAAQSDASAPIDAEADAPTLDMATPPSFDAGPHGCIDVLARDLDLDVDGDGRDGQIHAALAFDGDALWVVYSEPEGSGTGFFDVRARRFGCDGAPRGGSIAVQSVSDGNDVDPEIAIGDDGAVIVWVKDDGSGGTGNLQVFARAIDRDGTPGATEQRVTTQRDAMPVLDSHLDARIVAVADSFLLAGVRALPEVMRFQAFVQPLDAAGVASDPTHDVVVEMGVTHGQPALAAQSADDGWIAYEREEDTASDGDVMLARLDGSIGPTPVSTELESTASPSLALDATDPARAWIAFQGEVLSGEVDVWVVDASEPEATRANVRFGERRRLDHSPVLAADDRGGGAVAWYRNTSGIRNELWVARFASGPDDAPLRAGEPVLVASDVPPYAPAITHVAADVFALGYAQGTSPAFRLHARFVELLAPPAKLSE